jgi:pyruvate/2-oxoglutarate/acetoin dehydrogenase E1 component
LRRINYREALKEALAEEMDRDERVIVIGEDIGVYGGSFKVTLGLLEKYGPHRIIDTPISENSLIGVAVGAAMHGMRPVAEISFIDFITLAMDQIVNGAAKIPAFSQGLFKTPLVVRTQGGIGRGIGGHHEQSLEAWFVHVPGLKVVMPSTPYDAKGLLKTSIRDGEAVIFIENKKLYPIEGEIPEEEYLIPLGKADIKREGTDLTVIATSYMVHESLKAAEILEGEGISIEIVDPRTLVPFDYDTVLDSVKKTGKVLITHEAVKRGGIGAEISAIIAEEAFDYLKAPICRLASPNIVIPYNYSLDEYCIPSVNDIVSKVREILGK